MAQSSPCKVSKALEHISPNANAQSNLDQPQRDEEGVEYAQTEDEHVDLLRILEVLSFDVSGLNGKEDHQDHYNPYQTEGQRQPEAQGVTGALVTQQYVWWDGRGDESLSTNVQEKWVHCCFDYV